MVRVVRFAWDDEEGNGLPDRHDRFDDLDEPLLDFDLPESFSNLESAEHRNEKKTPRQHPQPNQASEERHPSNTEGPHDISKPYKPRWV